MSPRRRVPRPFPAETLGRAPLRQGPRLGAAILALMALLTGAVLPAQTPDTQTPDLQAADLQTPDLRTQNLAPSFEPEALEALERSLGELFAESPVPGAAIALVALGDEGSSETSIWTTAFGTAAFGTAAFGTAAFETDRPVTAETLFRANSVSKSLIALTLLRLQEEGALSLGDRLAERLPELAMDNPWEETHPLRVAHLLEHTTGFDELHLREYAFRPEDGGLREALAVNPAPRTARWPPGTRMAYNNGAYAVAALLIEEVTGEPFEVAVEGRVLRPLGMDRSVFGLDRVPPEDREALAVPYRAARGSEPQAETAAPYPLLIRPAGGLITSADDLAQLVLCLLRRGAPLLQPSSVRRMERPQTTEAALAGVEAGYGLGSYTSPSLSLRGSRGPRVTWHGHAGGTPSAHARYAYSPALGAGYGLLLNGNDGEVTKRLEATIQRFLAQGHPEPGPEVREPLPAAVVDGATGLYRQTTSAWQLTAGLERLFDVQRVRPDGNGLALVSLLGGAPRPLIPVTERPGDPGTASSGELFRFAGEAEPSVVFLRDEAGAVTGLRTWDPENLRAGNYRRVGPWLAHGAPAALLVSVLLMLSWPVVLGLRALARGVRALPGRRSAPGSASDTPRLLRALPRLLPLLAVLSWLGALTALALGASGPEGLLALGRPGGAAIAYWLLSLLFPLLSAAALAATAWALLRISPTAASPAGTRLARAGQLYGALVALACLVVAGFMASWGWIGLRPWAF